MRDIAARGLLFLDDGSSARSLTGNYAKALGMPHAFGDLQLDAQLQEQAILQKLDELERIARRKGSAIGIARLSTKPSPPSRNGARRLRPAAWRLSVSRRLPWMRRPKVLSRIVCDQAAHLAQQNTYPD